MKQITISDNGETRTYELPDEVADSIESSVRQAGQEGNGSPTCTDAPSPEEANRQLAEQKALLEHFVKAYASAYTVNLEDDTFEILHMDHAFQRVFTMNGTREDMLRYVENHVHPDDRVTVHQFIDNRYLMKRLETESELTFTIREQYDGAERTMRAVIMRGVDPAHVMVGFMDVTDAMLRERAVNRRLEIANKAMEDYRKAVLAHAIIAFTANLSRDRITSGFWVDDEGRQVSLRDILGLDLPCSYDRYITLWNQKFVSGDSENRFGSKTDRETLLTAYAAGQSEITFDYTAATISGQEKFLRRVISLSGDSETGDVIAYTNVKDVTEERQKEFEIITQTNIINRLTDEYLDVYLVDVKSQLVRPLRTAGHAVGVEDALAEKAPYAMAMAMYIQNNVYEADQREMTDATRFWTLCGALRESGDFLYHYRAHAEGDEVHYYYMQASRLGEAEEFSQIVVGFACEDEEKQQERYLQNQLAVVECLSQDYEYIDCVRRTPEGTFEVSGEIRADPNILNHIPEFWGERSFSRRLALLTERVVYEPDRELFARQATEAYVREKLKTSPTCYINFRTFAEGKIHYKQAKFAAVRDEAGEIQYYVAAFRDVDEEKRQQLEHQQALEKALSMAQSASRAKTTFLNNMSHDIRTPMNAIIGYTGLALSHLNSREQVQDYLGKIEQSSSHLLSLINDVLDMSRIESGKIKVEEKEENLAEILHTLRNIVQADVHAKNLEFSMDSVDVNDVAVLCDRLRLNQVLLNVLSNALKYTPAGGAVSLRIREKGVEDGCGRYEFRVKDNGIGMSEEFVKTIFDPFTRVESSTVSGIQGTGLGMAITKNIVDMMGGTIEVRSEEGKGTEVIIEFRFRLAAEQSEPEPIPAIQGLRGLVVDDDMDTCSSVSGMLADMGARSEWCASGREAVFRAKEALERGDAYGLYIIDLLMPDMNGMETVRRIRRAVGDEPPIYILSAYERADFREEAEEAGVTAFLNKPLFPSDLYSILKSRFGEKSAAPETVEKPDYGFGGRRLLLVEDNEMNREIALAILEEEDFVVDTAEDGTVAVERMRQAAPGQYDLILMDIQMPVMDGYEATRRIRALEDPAAASIPIVAMTANAFEEDRQAAFAAGMNEHVAKPIDVKQLKEVMARFL